MPQRKLIGEAAEQLNINRKTIRYYEEIDLIPEADRNGSGYRVFGKKDLERLEFILRAKTLEFSLDDIAEILDFRERGEAPCRYVADLIQQKMTEVDDKIRALHRLRSDLEELAEEAEGLPDEVITEKDCICHLIENRQSSTTG